MKTLLKKAPFELIGLGLILFFILVAEAYRLKGYLLLDLWAPIFAGLWTLKMLLLKKFPWRHPLLLPAILFLGIGTGSLLLHSQNMTWGEWVSSFFYVIRWASLFILTLIVSVQEKPVKRAILWMIFGFGALLALAGFAQLKLVPDFNEEFTSLGWDPHRGRLLSTWFDPNFTGGGLGLVLLLMIGNCFDEKRARPWLAPLMLVILLAIGLTYSRSAYLFLAFGVLVFGLIRSWKMLGLMTIAFLLLFAGSDRIQDRVIDMVEGAQSIVTETYTNPDPSARLRFESWELGWDLFMDQPLIGQGYNRFKFEALEQKKIIDLNNHAVSGSDSSIFTALATTGVLGTIPLLSLYFILAWQAWQHRKEALAIAFLSILAGLAIHSVFVNSLFFPPLMALFWLAAGLLPPLKYVRN